MPKILRQESEIILGRSTESFSEDRVQQSFVGQIRSSRPLPCQLQRQVVLVPIN